MKLLWCKLNSIGNISLSNDTSSNVFTHNLLYQLNEKTKCLENPDVRSKIPSVTLVGQEAIANFDSFDFKAFQKFLNELQKRRTLAQMAIERERLSTLRQKKSDENSESDQEMMDNDEPEEAEEDEEENDNEAETNTQRMCHTVHHHEQLLCCLLADYESTSMLIRSN